ncbi:MAG: [Fe-Fe] hydrogenase large subunit C-terminal domain-containing protein [Synergistaceae bacterium]|nr:[Fe-Fe] hydrogenase large subunit C-terminal domain-containing protein [Synergistaceae bacterium]
MKYINVAEANCKNCYKCLKVCPVKSIKYSDNHVEVLENECILCGRCIRNCPQHAKSLLHDISGLKEAVREGAHKKIAALAPSYIAAFGAENRFRVAGALQSLGFDAVEETSVGAHAVTREYAAILERGAMDIMITTCCPSVVFLVQKYFPELTPQLAPVLSPMEAHGQLLRKKYGEEALIIFFAPCISKIEEARASEKGYIDGVVTFNQLSRWLAEDGAEIEKSAEGYFGNDPSSSAIYPIFEGIVKDVRANLSEDSDALRKYTFLSAQGAKDVIELLEEMREGRIHSCFIEASACYGSCINGPEKPDSEYHPISTAIDMTRYLRAERNIRETETSSLDLSRRIMPEPLKEKMPDEKTIRGILAQIGKTKPEHELNCGSCGYRSCRDKAIAVYQKKAELYMCLPYMSQISETLANVTLSVSPDYIIAVDRELRVKECNLAAQRLLKLTKNELLGRRIDEFLDPLDFAVAIGEERSVPLHKVSCGERGITVNQTVVYIPEQGLAIAFLHDITKQERETEALNRLKMETMEMAQNVIDKQMTVAQEIASLLGETTAETKVTLTKLKDLIVYDGQKNNG